MFPSKIRSFMSATVAMVVPSLKVFELMTVLPTFTGMSRMRPATEDRTRVELPDLLDDDTPSRMISRDSTDAAYSSWACLRAWATCSKASALTSCWSNRFFWRS